MQYQSTISWKNTTTAFDPKSYDRTHTIAFGSGTSITSSSAPEFLGNAALPNPEELFTASISSCLMLTFLYIAATKGYIIATYTAEASGTLAKNEQGKMAMTEVIIKPQVTFSGNTPETNELSALFHKAHENCFISCSVKTKVVVSI